MIREECQSGNFQSPLSGRIAGPMTEGGATLDEMVAATGWLPHTTRAALTGLKKKGHLVTSEKVDDLRRYRVAAASPVAVAE
jgi:hypothetical protein